MLRSAAGVGFSLADSTSICLQDCPALLPGGQLPWVCKYPYSGGVQWVDAGAVPSLDAWASASYDYFAQLNSTLQASSCALKGPCYPVLTPQRDSHATCQYEALTDLPLNTAAVASFQQCVNCCGEAAPAADPACGVTDGAGHPTVFDYAGNTSSANGYINCLASCENLHQTIQSFVSDTTASISPTAYAQFTTTCAAATGAPPAAVPAPGTQDGGLLAQAAAAVASSKKSMAERYVGDLMKGWKAMIVCGLFLPFILSLVWMVLLRFLAAPLVWTTIAGLDFGLLALTLFCFAKAGVIGNDPLGAVKGAVSVSNGRLDFNASNVTAALNASVTNVAALTNASAAAFANATSDPQGLIIDVAHNAKLQMYYLGVASIIATILAWIATAIFIPRIKIAIATLKVACDVMASVPSLVLQPVFAAAITVLFMGWWVVSAVYVYSSGDIVKRNCCAAVQASLQQLYPSLTLPNATLPDCASIPCGYEVVMNNPLRYSLIYHGFELLWGTQMIVALGVLTVSQVVYAYYAAAGGAGEPMPTFGALPRAGFNAARFYAGPAAFASFLVALVQFFQYAMAYISSRTKAVQQAHPVAKLVVWLVNGLLAALEKLMSFISKNSLILVAIEGHGFCAAAAAAVGLVLKYAARIATVATIGNTILFIGKLATAASCAFFTFVYLENVAGISSPLLPVIVVAFVSFGIATLFFGVVASIIETVILAFCQDCDKHGGTPAWAPPLLMDAMGAVSAFQDKAPQKDGKEGDAAPADAEAGQAGGDAVPVSTPAGG